LKFVVVIRERLKNLGYRGTLDELGFDSFKRLIVLLPESCHLSLRDEAVLRAEHIYKLDQIDAELADPGDNKYYDLRFP
jgi:hypothetical protein